MKARFTKKRYDVALIVTFETETYEDALQEAKYLAAGIGDREAISCSAVLTYERDNEGQRVLYLPNEESA